MWTLIFFPKHRFVSLSPKFSLQFHQPFYFLTLFPFYFMDPTFRTGFARENSPSSSPHNTCPSMGWTNEKHRLYIDSLEADFVKKLHYSIELRQGVTRHCSSHQINHFTSASKKNFASSQELENSATSCASSLEPKQSMHQYDWRQDSTGSNLEVSDQNFVDENAEEKPKGKSRVKRWKSNWR